MLLRKVEEYNRDDGLVDKVKLKMGKTNFQNVGGAALNKPVTKIKLLCEIESVRFPNKGASMDKK